MEEDKEGGEAILSEFITYVETQIKKYQQFTKLHEESHLTPEMINTALASYEEINLILIALYNKNKIEEYNVNKQYTRWYDKNLSVIRKEMIEETTSKTIKIAVKEYELELRVRHETEYWEWQDKITSAENKTSFILRIVEAWKTYDKILVTLSSNMRGEMYALSLDSRINFDQDKIRVFPQRRKLEEKI
jgi:hypothetical protein